MADAICWARDDSRHAFAGYSGSPSSWQATCRRSSDVGAHVALPINIKRKRITRIRDEADMVMSEVLQGIIEFSGAV